MKLLFFIDSLMAGGKERRLTELIKALSSKEEFEISLIVMNSEIHYKGILDLNITINYLIRKTKKDFSVFEKLYRICKSYKPDIIHCWDAMTAIYAIPVCKLLGIKLVNGLVVDTPIKKNVLNKKWLWAKLTFPFSDIIVGNSKAGLTAYKVPKNKSYLIYNGFDFKRVENLTEPLEIRHKLEIKTTFIVGMVAAFSKYKDYKTYFKAAEKVLGKNRDVTFVAIGANTDSGESKKLIDSEYKSCIRLIGRKLDIESYINAMDICVLATFTEGISNSVVEYMALGKPVIATLGGGTAEIVKDSITGFLINQGDSDKLAQNMEILLKNNEVRKKMGAEGQARIHQDFSIKAMIRAYTNCYNHVLNNNNVEIPQLTTKKNS